MSEKPIIAVYADGGVIGLNPSAIGGTWAWCQVGEDGERLKCASGIIRPSPELGLFVITNNVTEFAALARALRALPDGWSGQVYSDSRITLGRFFEGWKLEGIPVGWGDHIQYLRKRLGVLEWTLLDGHPTKAQLAAGIGKRGNPVSAHNAWCDKECNRLAKGEK
jgi:ribonuclease HI